ncbi:MAG TPA: hypothetical protein VGJ20_30225 [Xanthobacteraceae bacterium]|jgi:hypothetical protein
MSLVDFVEAWWLSVRPLLEAAGVVGRFSRWSDDGGMNPSCVLTFRRNELEIDLAIWEFGAAELGTIERGGSINQQHFDDVRTPTDFGMILSRFIYFVSDTPSE